MKRKKKKLTEGSIFKSILVLSLPIIFANILQTSYQLIDTFRVGQLGTEAVAAVSLSFPIIFLIIAVGIGITMAGNILVAQYTGKDNQRAVNHISGQTMLMVFIASLLLSVIGYFLSPTLMQLMGAKGEVLNNALSYMQISFIGMVFMFGYMSFQSLMRGVGDVKTPMYIVLGTVLLNLLLDPLFIYGRGPIPASGVSGAALATLTTQALAAVVGFYVLTHGKFQIQLNPKDFLTTDRTLMKKMFKLGYPTSIELSGRALGLAVMTRLAGTFSTLTVATYGIGTRVLGFIIIPAMGLSIATSTLIGQNIGAGKVDRAEKIVKYSSWAGFLSLTIIGILIFIFATPIAKLFVPGETATILETTKFLQIMALSFGFIGLQLVYNGVFRGSGNTKIAMLLSLILWFIQFPLAYYLSTHTNLGTNGIWISFPISNILMAIIAYFRFKQGKRKEKNITEEIKVEMDYVE